MKMKELKNNQKRLLSELVIGSKSGKIPDKNIGLRFGNGGNDLHSLYRDGREGIINGWLLGYLICSPIVSEDDFKTLEENGFISIQISIPRNIVFSINKKAFDQ